MEYTEKVIISWDRLAEDCRTLANRIKEKGNVPTRILAVTRGGLVVAGLVCRALNIKDIETIGLESYHGKEQTEDLKILKTAHPDYLKGTLILDDLVDTGKTYDYLRSITQDCMFGCVYAKPIGRNHTDVHAHDFEQNEWVEFPWETFENND